MASISLLIPLIARITYLSTQARQTEPMGLAFNQSIHVYITLYASHTVCMLCLAQQCAIVYRVHIR